MLKKLYSPVDMTVGTPWKNIIRFTLPMLVGNIAQQLYGTVDTIVVGRFAADGDNAIAAIGSTLSVLNMLLVLFTGISAGVGIMVAQNFGARDKKALSFTVGNSISLTAIASGIIMLIALLFLRPVLIALNTPEAILDYAHSYLLITLVGIAGKAYFNILSGILRGLGDSVSALFYLLIASSTNIVLDLFFVIALKMGVKGVAIATIISQFISAILCLLKLSKKSEYISLGIEYLKIKKIYLKEILRLGLPTGLTQAVFSSAGILVQSLTNLFGAQFVAANSVVMKINDFAMMPCMSFGTALITYAGQNKGAERYDRIKRGAKQGTLIAIGYSAIAGLVLVFFGKCIVGLFTETNELVISSYHLVIILAGGYMAVSISQCLLGVMRGMGDTVTPMWISLITTFAIRVPLAYGIAYFTRSEALPNGIPESIHISLLIFWVLNALIVFSFYKYKKIWNKEK